MEDRIFYVLIFILSGYVKLKYEPFPYSTPHIGLCNNIH